MLLEDIAVRGSGHTPSKSNIQYYNGGIKWVSLADSKKLDNGYIEDTMIKISTEGIKNSSAVLHPEGSVLLSRDAGVGKSAVMKYEMAVSQHFIVWQGKENVLSNWFLYNILQILKPEFERIAIGSTIKTIGLPYFKKLKISIPKFPEQQKIASFLSAVDQKLKQLTRKKELLELYKKGVMQQLFSGKLRFKDEHGKDYPEWEEKRLGEVTKLTGGFAFKSALFKNSGIPVIRISNISNTHNYIDLTNVVYYDKIPNAESFTINSGDLIVAMSGATTGKASIYNITDCAYLNQRVGLFKSKTSKLFYGFLVQFVFYDDFKKQLDSVLVAGAQPNVSSSDIESFAIPFPAFGEQQKIAAFLSSLDSKIEQVSTQISITQTFKKGLLQQMFV
jgi:type I restriction enzyme, S subunit